MSLTDDMDHVRLDLHQVEEDMQGINPKLSLYKQLAERKAALLKRLEQMGAKRTAKK